MIDVSYGLHLILANILLKGTFMPRIVTACAFAASSHVPVNVG